MTEPEVVWRDPAAVNYYDGPPFDSTFGADVFRDGPTWRTDNLDDLDPQPVVLAKTAVQQPSVAPPPERIVQAPLWQPGAPAVAPGPTPLWQPAESAAAAERTPLWASAERGPVAPRPTPIGSTARRPQPPILRDPRLRQVNTNIRPQPVAVDPRATDPRFRTPNKRRRGRLGFIPALIVFGLVVAGNVPGIYRSFSSGSSASAAKKVVNQYYDAVERHDVATAAGQICAAQRFTWLPAAQASSGDLRDVFSYTVNAATKVGGGYAVGVVVGRHESTARATLTVVKESGAWKICGGTN